MFTTSVTALETWKMWLMYDHGHDFSTASNVHSGRKVFNTDQIIVINLFGHPTPVDPGQHAKL